MEYYTPKSYFSLIKLKNKCGPYKESKTNFSVIFGIFEQNFGDILKDRNSYCGVFTDKRKVRERENLVKLVREADAENDEFCARPLFELQSRS